MTTPNRSASDEQTPTARQREIVDLVEQQGFVAIEALARSFDITQQTARRDVNALCEAGLLRRYHGGAGLPSTVENLAYEARQVLNLEGKRKIAELVAREIPDHASLFLTLGTTTKETARALAGHKGLRVITNNLQIAGMLSASKDAEVMVAGGTVRSIDAGVTGEMTLDFFNNFKVDYALMSISGIESDGTLFDFDYREVRLLRVIIANARRVFLLADQTKYNRHALVRAGNIVDCIDALFTDVAPPKPLADLLAEAGVSVHVAE
ncbi:DeoR/GlpR family DNA-binding transcription regulator [Salinisphaera sp. LB1]|uniref:DeoR/GlpR family DNA-binding transcription regulator n=1 Tax=Salinisphaera sp. LB1 TaxID=2183911 RepID=UPI000D705881|nr:DeoR/GlpR family DNA-binding transcription regulator [Salinisphaera sp. LB1]AWN16795.1 Glycerol-3-phosphate regulon repressor, DeoR family [Salinisphaera sp. LB1]